MAANHGVKAQSTPHHYQRLKAVDSPIEAAVFKLEYLRSQQFVNRFMLLVERLLSAIENLTHGAPGHVPAERDKLRGIIRSPVQKANKVCARSLKACNVCHGCGGQFDRRLARSPWRSLVSLELGKNLGGRRPEAHLVTVAGYLPINAAVQNIGPIVAYVRPAGTRTGIRKRRLTRSGIAAQQHTTAIQRYARGMHWGSMTGRDAASRHAQEKVLHICWMAKRCTRDSNSCLGAFQIDDAMVVRIRNRDHKRKHQSVCGHCRTRC